MQFCCTDNSCVNCHSLFIIDLPYLLRLFGLLKIWSMHDDVRVHENLTYVQTRLSATPYEVYGNRTADKSAACCIDGSMTQTNLQHLLNMLNLLTPSLDCRCGFCFILSECIYFIHFLYRASQVSNWLTQHYSIKPNHWLLRHALIDPVISRLSS